MIYDRIMPHDIEIERAVLSACMLGDEDAIDAAEGILTAEAFYSGNNRHIWEAILALHQAGSPVDTISLRVALEQAGHLEKIGGAVALLRLAWEVGTSANILYHAGIVRSLYLKRAMILRASALVDACYDPLEAVEDMSPRIGALSLLTAPAGKFAPRPTWELAGESMPGIVEAIRNRQTSHAVGGVETGLSGLDEVLDGLQPSDSIIVAGRPSVGKTALGLVLAWNVADRLPVGFISVEMTTRALQRRLLAMVSGLDAHAMRRGRLGAEQLEKLRESSEEVRHRPLFISETLREPGHILREAGELHRDHGIDLLVIDYLQLLDAPMRDIRSAGRNREQEVSATSRAIKALAKELRIPVVTLAQLSRAPERREGKRPILSDLRESGAIEQDGDVVILLHRPALCGEVEVDGQDVTRLLEANVAKQRNGPREVVRLYFDEATGRILNWGDEHADRGPEF